MPEPSTCAYCAEPLPSAGAERCPACGERPAEAPRPPTQAGSGPTGAPARRSRRPLLLACGAVALGLCLVLGAVAVVSNRPAWYGRPELEPLFVAPATPRPAPAPAHVRVGERWVFHDEWNRKGGGSQGAEVVWEVVAVGPEGVRYVAHEGSTTAPEATWVWTPLLKVQDIFTGTRGELEVGGRTFDAAQVHLREWRSMMNDVQAHVSVAMDGDRPTFPGVVKTVRSNQSLSQDGWTLVRVEPPRDRPAPGR